MILAQSISKIWTESFLSLNKCMVKERWIRSLPSNLRVSLVTYEIWRVRVSLVTNEIWKVIVGGEYVCHLSLRGVEVFGRQVTLTCEAPTSWESTRTTAHELGDLSQWIALAMQHMYKHRLRKSPTHTKC